MPAIVHSVANRSRARWNPALEDANRATLSAKSRDSTLAFFLVTQSGVVLLRAILSIKIMNRSGDNSHPCRRPTRTRNEFNILPLIRTWLLQSLYKDRMVARRRPLISYSFKTLHSRPRETRSDHRPFSSL